jgi:hypothetical protein
VTPHRSQFANARGIRLSISPSSKRVI